MIKDLVSQKDLEDFSKSHPCAAVLFSAEWSKPCQLFLPILEQTAHLAPEGTAFAQMDADAFPALQEQYGVRSLPTLVCFQNGTQIRRSVGLQTPSGILEQLR